MGDPTRSRLSTGVDGLDTILDGGLIAGRAYLVRGGPGVGKTILGLHFLTAGAGAGEATLIITLEESEERIRENARAIGLDLNGIGFLDLSPTSEFFTKAQTYDIFTPAEVEREPTTQKIVERIEACHPRRVFLEVMTQFRYLSPDPFQFHRQLLSFLRFLLEQGATVLFSSEGSPAAPDEDLQFVSDGVIQLESSPAGRAVRVIKHRGSDFRDGRHALRLTDRGMRVFPRLEPAEHGRQFVAQAISSGLAGLDELLGGGLERGTVTVISGPSGVGKTSVGLSFIKEAAGRGERSVVYTFEEYAETLVRRSEAIQIPVGAMAETGALAIEQVEPLRYTPDEFAALVRRAVEQDDACIVMLDSLAGYRLCMQGEDLINHVHALCAYLRNMGVTVLLINEVEAVTGVFRATEIGISYLVDNIVFLRYVEMYGALRRVVGVLKKRVSAFEETVREIEITGGGIKVGRPLSGLHGILAGIPVLVNPPESCGRADEERAFDPGGGL